MSLLWYPAPAKLNLGLRIVGRRDDGYHLLQTIFQIIDLNDELAFEPSPDGQVSRGLVEGSQAAAIEAVDWSKDLCLRAALALRAATGVSAGVRIHLRKNIPLGGGLGGGSSDAATALCVLNRLWGTALGVDRLAELALPLGADVPVFVRGRSAAGEGVGEKLTPIELPPACFVVVHPGVPVATRDVFQAPELTRNSAILTIRALLASGDLNDCEPVVRARVPEVAAALDWLGGFATARLTGTGACIYARFASADTAAEVVRQVPRPWRAWVVRGLSESPLLRRLEEL